VLNAHFKYATPKFVRLRGEFRWAFELEKISATKTQLASSWLGCGEPRLYAAIFVKPWVWLIDHMQQPAMLKDIKRRAEQVDIHQSIAAYR